MQDPVSARGSCLCGTVRFEYAFPSKWCAHCYCQMCRKAHGAGFVTWVGVPVEQFRIIEGDAALIVYDSSPGAKRRFCRICGSSLFFESEKWPGEMHIALGCLDSEADRLPEGNAFADDRVHWIDLQATSAGPEAQG